MKMMYDTTHVLTKIDAQYIRRIRPPRLGMFIGAMKYNTILFLMYFICFNPIVFIALCPMYIIVIYNYNILWMLCTKYGYKKIILILFTAVFNVLSCIAARYIFNWLMRLLHVI